MAYAYASTVIDAPADKVWSVVRDFNGLGTWNAKFIPTCEIEEGKAGDQVGAVRSFTLADGAHLREQLLAHSDRDRLYTYNFLKHPFEGVENYVSTIHVLPVTDTNQTFVEWSVTFDCPPDELDQWQGFYANKVFRPGLEALKSYVAA
jgi:hypothetical protein